MSGLKAEDAPYLGRVFFSAFINGHPKAFSECRIGRLRSFLFAVGKHQTEAERNEDIRSIKSEDKEHELAVRHSCGDYPHRMDA